jgi:hypothetical protein
MAMHAGLLEHCKTIRLNSKHKTTNSNIYHRFCTDSLRKMATESQMSFSKALAYVDKVKVRRHRRRGLVPWLRVY